MTKLKKLLLSAKFASLTGLCSRTRNKTRWSSTFYMLQRYQKICDHLRLLNSHDLDGLALITAKDRRVKELLEHLEILDSITKPLRKASTKWLQCVHF